MNKLYVIELWDRENEHVYLATDDDGGVYEFESKEDAYHTACRIVDHAYQYLDREFDFFLTKTPHRLAVPLK